jgi:hypothetical protein
MAAVGWRGALRAGVELKRIVNSHVAERSSAVLGGTAVVAAGEGLLVMAFTLPLSAACAPGRRAYRRAVCAVSGYV